ncbi:MAG: hypothetical protein ACK559_15915, partial [bacterium]
MRVEHVHPAHRPAHPGRLLQVLHAVPVRLREVRHDAGHHDRHRQHAPPDGGDPRARRQRRLRLP